MNTIEYYIGKMNKSILFALFSITILSSCYTSKQTVDSLYEKQYELEAKIDRLTELVESSVQLIHRDINRLGNNQFLLTDQIERLERTNTTLKKKLNSVDKNVAPVEKIQPTPNEVYANADENFQHGKYEDAILDFQKFIDSYPSDSRVADAYLKQGLSLTQLGRNKEAKFFFRTLIDKYPNSAEAKKAKNKMRTI